MPYRRFKGNVLDQNLNHFVDKKLKSSKLAQFRPAEIRQIDGRISAFVAEFRLFTIQNDAVKTPLRHRYKPRFYRLVERNVSYRSLKIRLQTAS